MTGFITYLYYKLCPPKIADETPVQIWIIDNYGSSFKYHLKDQIWGESEFKDSKIEPGEYGFGNPVFIVINMNSAKGQIIDQNTFNTRFGHLPTLSSDQVREQRDEYGQTLKNAVAELQEFHQRIMK